MGFFSSCIAFMIISRLIFVFTIINLIFLHRPCLILLHACSFTESVCKNVLLIHDLASILSFSKISLCYFINVRLFQLETWMKTNLVSLLNNYGSDDLTTSETSTSWNYLFMLVSIKWKMVILTGKTSKLNKSKNYFPKTSFQRKLYIVLIFCTIVKI